MEEPNPTIRVIEGVVHIWDPDRQEWVEVDHVTPPRPLREKDWRKEA